MSWSNIDKFMDSAAPNNNATGWFTSFNAMV